MPEGPSILLFSEDFHMLVGQVVLKVSGAAKLDKKQLKGQTLKQVKTWGKHFLFCFEDLTLQVHLLLFGKYYINNKRTTKPKLSLKFSNDEVNFYATSQKLLPADLDEVYDWSADVLSIHWNAAAARKKLKQAKADTIVADALLNQDVFAGVGNIIKNEVLHRARVHPASRLSALTPRKLTELVKEAANFSHDFLEWKRKNQLVKNLKVHKKKSCERDSTSIEKEYIGRTGRRAFFCPTCQKLYT